MIVDRIKLPLHNPDLCVFKDLKPANLLISSEGVLKIADFSLSRLILSDNGESGDGDNRSYTSQVATRRYRAPELLFGFVHYDQSVDMWSVGCILAEMQMKTPLFAVSYNDSEPIQCLLQQFM